jgi:integrase/recombinase XerD
MTGQELRSHLDGYLALRAALSYKVQQARLDLNDFLQYIERQAPDLPISAQLALDWACSVRYAAGGQAGRLSRVRGFLYYLRVSEPATEVPEFGLIATPRRSNPYIYSSEQICRLIHAAEELEPSHSLRPHTYATMIGLMASAGLRMGEALHLTDADVRLADNQPVLMIRESKFRKSRVVPVHATVADRLRAYRLKRGRSESFFKNEGNRALSASSVWTTFDEIRKRAGVQPTPDGRRPTLRALRHTFAVNRILEWYQQGLDVNRWLPHLSVYMGHVEPRDTYWYLSATPELLRRASDSFKHYAGKEDAL